LENGVDKTRVGVLEITLVGTPTLNGDKVKKFFKEYLMINIIKAYNYMVSFVLR